MKSRINWSYFTYSFLFVFVVLFNSCKVERKEQRKSLYEQEAMEDEYASGLNLLLSYVSAPSSEEIESDLDRIKKRGKLIALVGYGPSSYFVYKGTPMGFEYDLLKLLAKDLGVKLEIVIVNDKSRLIEMLNNGEGDIIADDFTVTKELENVVDFTLPVLKSRQVLVQRKPKNWKYMSYAAIEASLIRDADDLIGQPVYVRKESVYHKRLVNLSDEIGGNIQIMEVAEALETDEMINWVADGKIEFTIADENTAMIHAASHPNLDIRTAISFDQRIAWAVREDDNSVMLNKINTWISKVKKDGRFKSIYNKYYYTRIGIDQMLKCTKDDVCGRNLSPYDKWIIHYASTIGWDWRLLASLIYQESQFNPIAKSWAGACGLMQLMPATAQCFGAYNPEDPIQSLEAGTKYLKWLDHYWAKKVPNKEERLKFVIASYNVGQEHVADAQRLAAKYEKDPKVWDENVAYFLLNKSLAKYNQDPVVKYGYCRGSEPFDYVINILDRYEHYKKLIREEV